MTALSTPVDDLETSHITFKETFNDTWMNKISQN